LCSVGPAGGCQSANGLVAEIGAWTLSNPLKLNGGQMKFIWLGLAHVSSWQSLYQLVMPVDKVHDLGVITDSELSMDAQAQNVIRSCFYQLCSLWR